MVDNPTLFVFQSGVSVCAGVDQLLSNQPVVWKYNYDDFPAVVIEMRIMHDDVDYQHCREQEWSYEQPFSNHPIVSRIKRRCF